MAATSTRIPPSSGIQGALTSDSARLAGIRGSLDAIAPGIWTRAADGEGEFVEARGEMGELVPVVRFHPGATLDERRFVADAPEAVRFLLRLVDRAISASRAASRAAPAGAPAGAADGGRAPVGAAPSAGGGAISQAKDFAAEAAIKCQSPAFKLFLHERHGLERPLTTERAAQKLRSLLGVRSRRELNVGRDAAGAQTGNPEGLARWKQIRADFREWRGR